jgi:hypothetical protein
MLLQAAAQTHYLLTLIFNQAGEHVGSLPNVSTVLDPTNPSKYLTWNTYADCFKAGLEWLKPASNPMNTVRTFICTIQK